MKMIHNQTYERSSEAHEKLDDVKREVEKLLEQFYTQLATLIERANDARDETYAALDNATNDAESYYEERSEKWQEGEAGQVYSQWKDELANAHDMLLEELLFEVEEVAGLSELENMIALDGGFIQSPED